MQKPCLTPFLSQNHFGDLDGGHYTAFCKNSVTQAWYSFYDTRVSEIPDTSVQTATAYLLFYSCQPFSMPIQKHRSQDSALITANQPPGTAVQCVLSLNPYNLFTALRSVSLTDGLHKTSKPKKTQSLLTKGGMCGHHGSLRTVGSEGQCLMRRVPIIIYFISTKLFSKNLFCICVHMEVRG